MKFFSSRLPEGCGNTEHYQDCAIRRTVMVVHATGRGQSQAPCYQDIETFDGMDQSSKQEFAAQRLIHTPAAIGKPIV